MTIKSLARDVLAHDSAEECQECGIGQSQAWDALRVAVGRAEPLDLGDYEEWVHEIWADSASPDLPDHYLPYRTVQQARDNGFESGTLASGDTFGHEDAPENDPAMVLLARRHELLRGLFIATAGLPGELGELLEPIKKAVRKHVTVDELPSYLGEAGRKELANEAGDVLYYLARVAKACGFTLQDAIEANVEKLVVRYAAHRPGESASPPEPLA